MDDLSKVREALYQTKLRCDGVTPDKNTQTQKEVEESRIAWGEMVEDAIEILDRLQAASLTKAGT